MLSLNVYARNGEVVGTVEIDDSILEERINFQLLHNAVVMYEANLRRGTHSTKRRGEVAYSGRKPWVQKGTGRARAGSRGSPIWRGGGVSHGPKPRDYYQRLPKKALKKALKHAFISKLKDEEVRIVDELRFGVPKTKEVATILKTVGIDRSCLILPSENDTNVYLSGRNIDGVSVMPACDVNAYQILRHKYLLMSKESFFGVCRKLGIHDVRSKEVGISRPASGDTPSDSDGEI